MNELIVKYKVATCHYTELWFTDLQFTISKWAMSITYKWNIYKWKWMKDFYGYSQCVNFIILGG